MVSGAVPKLPLGPFREPRLRVQVDSTGNMHRVLYYCIKSINKNLGLRDDIQASGMDNCITWHCGHSSHLGQSWFPNYEMFAKIHNKTAPYAVFQFSYSIIHAGQTQVQMAVSLMSGAVISKDYGYMVSY